MVKQVTTEEKKFTWVTILSIAYVVWWGYSNPILLHQKVQVGGVTVAVPFGWVVSRNDRPLLYEATTLRRAFVPGWAWSTATIFLKAQPGPYTMESARGEQTRSVDRYQNPAWYSNARTFELGGGKYPSPCAGATMMKGPHARILSCFVVGTPLQFQFMSPRPVDGDAARILASLE